MDVFYLIVFLRISFKAGKMSSKSKVKTGAIWWHQGTLKYLKVPFLTISFLSETEGVCDIPEFNKPCLWQI